MTMENSDTKVFCRACGRVDYGRGHQCPKCGTPMTVYQDPGPLGNVIARALENRPPNEDAIRGVR